jgi:hypothetical protein
MGDPITVRNPFWVKGLIVVGLPGFAAAGAYLCWLSWKGGFGMSLEDALLAAFGAFCLLVAVNQSRRVGQSRRVSWAYPRLGKA